MPTVTRSNPKRSLAEVDANAGTAPRKRTSTSANNQKDNQENITETSEPQKEKCNGCSKDCSSSELTTQPITKPKPKPSANGTGGKSRSSAKAPMLIAKSRADAYNAVKSAKEKEKAERKEAKEKVKVDKKLTQEKEKSNKKEAKGKEKADKKATQEKEKAEMKKGNSHQKKVEKDSAQGAKDDPKDDSEIERVRAAGTGMEKMTPLSTKLKAEVKEQQEAAEAQNACVGKATVTKTNDEKDVGAGKGKKSSKNSKNQSARPTAAADRQVIQNPNAQNPVKWICTCRPMYDIRAEYGEDKVKDAFTCCSDRCMCEKPADEHPDHIWIFTKTGKDGFVTLLIEQQKRDQDSYGLYVYNDFSGYGTAEVMENQLLKFNKEFKKKPVSPTALWSEMEALSMFLNMDLFYWFQSDDSEKNAETVRLQGTALLTTIDILIKHNLFAPGTSIRNLGLILSLFIRFITDSCQDLCQDGEDEWTHHVIRLADNHGVKLQGLHGFEETLQRLRDEMDEDDEEENDLRSWDWKKEFAKFSRRFGPIGGSHYDLSKMSKKEREQYDLSIARF